MTAQRKAGPSQKPHGGRPLIPPHCLWHGQVTLQGADAVLPLPPEQVLPAQIVHIPVVLRILLHRQFQQGQVLSPGFLRIRVVVQLDPLRCHRRPRSALPHPLEHLMHRMHPPVSPACMDLIAPEHHALRAVLLEAPGIAVGDPAAARLPRPLQRLPPSRMEHLIQVGADTQVHILRHQFQGPVAGRVEPPGQDPLHSDLRSPGPQPLRRAILRPGIQHHHQVGLPHRVHPAVYKFLLIFTNGIHTYLIAAHFVHLLGRISSAFFSTQGRRSIENAAPDLGSFSAVVRQLASRPAVRRLASS